MDVSGHADDVMIICDSLGQLEKCIDFLEDWAAENRLPINHSESGIIFFQGRLGLTLETPGTVLKNYEFKSQYQYLGCILDRRLSFLPHFKHIVRKTNFIHHNRDVAAAHLYVKIM